MKPSLLSAYALAILCLSGSMLSARNPAYVQPPKQNQNTSANKTEIGTCNIPSSSFDLDINNVRTKVLNAGDQWWDLTNGKYEVPKGSKTSGLTYPQALFAGAIWVSALDQGGNLRIAAQTYRQGTSDFWAGPLDGNGNVSAATCNTWNRHFNVYGAEITADLANIAKTGKPLVTDNIKYWPGKGNANLIASGFAANDMDNILAPFFDMNGDGIYNPDDGDFPTIKQGGKYPSAFSSYCGYNGTPSTEDSIIYSNNRAFADQMIFWVMNDKGNTHTATNGTPMGIQVNELAFAFSSSDEINDMTFYTYNIINKSGSNFNNTFMSQWTDCDLGCNGNDRVGCDTSRSMAIQYNGTLDDEGSAICQAPEVGYKTELPMLGIDFFEGPSDTSYVIQNGVRKHKQLGMSSFCYFNISGGASTGDPQTAVQYRNYQTGKWKNGNPITYGGTGFGPGIPVNYTFPGDPSDATKWSECHPQPGAAIPYGDRRFVQTSGPFNFLNCASEPITIGVVFVQPQGGVGLCPSWSAIGGADDKAQALFDNHFNQLVGPTAPILNIREMDRKVVINFVDDPAGNNQGESFLKTDPLRILKKFKSPIVKPDTISVGHVVMDSTYLDSTYKFQGYILYQLVNDQVSVNDLNDASKAVVIAQYDIQDNIKAVVNWSQYVDPVTGSFRWVPDANTIPGIGTKLNNAGILHSYTDSIDHITGGRLVNYQTYYYGVLAFATNNFVNFNPNTDSGQTIQFLIGKNLNKYSVIPHDIETENGGRLFNSAWGQSTLIQRIEGQGNGGNNIDLNDNTVSGIMEAMAAGYYKDTLEYQVGFDPLGFKVVDPVLIKEADFELKIYDTVPYNGVSVSPKAWWELKDLTNNVTIHSQRSLDKPYEQIIADDLGQEYGFSLSLGTPFPVYVNQTNQQPIYGSIGGSISFNDPSHPWLSFVKDSGSTATPSNWIRSGTVSLPCHKPYTGTNDAACNVFTDATYTTYTGGTPIFTDSSQYFSKIADGKWGPYCLAANWSLGPGTPVTTGRTSGSVGGPGFKWDSYDDVASAPENNLEILQSVDIVITSDKSKWSECVVFETGDNPYVGDATITPDASGRAPRKGMLRNHQGLDKDGNPNGLYGMSWFPGYAINVETGQRLNIAFGEASDEGADNGRDMVWNPSSNIYSSFNAGGTIPYKPIFGGKHFIYVLATPYTDRYTIQGVLSSQATYTRMLNPSFTHTVYPDYVRNIYKQIMWTSIPYLTPGYTLKSMAEGIVPDNNTVTIRLRVQKPYAKLPTVSTGNPSVTRYRHFTRFDSIFHGDTLIQVNASPDSTAVLQDSFPRYRFSTVGLGSKENVQSIAKSSLDLIRIVPNPYLAYSSYEKGANDSRIKITNLPNICTIKIYSLDGVLVRTLQRSVSIDPVTNKKVEISDSYDLNDVTGSSNLDNSTEWDLKNEKFIPVGSGIYLFDIEVPGVGHKILKWFGAMRPTDVSNF